MEPFSLRGQVAVGAGYLTRPDNKGAKAGNINHALTKTTGEYVTIFDCDTLPSGLVSVRTRPSVS